MKRAEAAADEHTTVGQLKHGVAETVGRRRGRVVRQIYCAGCGKPRHAAPVLPANRIECAGHIHAAIGQRKHARNTSASGDRTRVECGVGAAVEVQAHDVFAGQTVKRRKVSADVELAIAINGRESEAAIDVRADGHGKRWVDDAVEVYARHTRRARNTVHGVKGAGDVHAAARD